MLSRISGGHRPVAVGALLVAIALAGTTGCRGRAAFFRGEEFARQGRDREAYYEFWEAYAQGGSLRYRAALDQTGRRVALRVREGVARLENDRQLTLALERVRLGLEYAPDAAVLREDYARLSRALLGWEDLVRELKRARDPDGDPWLALPILRQMAAHPGRPADWRSDWVEAVRRAVEADLAPLRQRSLATSLAGDPVAVEELAAAWAAAAARSRWVLYDEIPAVGPLRVTAAPALENLLRSTLVEASTARERLDAVRRAQKLRDEAILLEREGRLPEAYRMFIRASVVRGLESARDGRARVHRTFCADQYTSAVEAMRLGHWETACGRWGQLLAFAGDYRDAAELASTARRRQADERVLAARRYREVGLYGNALVRYHLVLQSFPEDAEALRVTRELERVLAVQARPRFPAPAKGASVEWDSAAPVEPAEVAAFHQLVQRHATALLEGEGGSSKLARAEPHAKESFVITLHRVSLTNPRLEKSAVFERSAYVKQFRMTQNPAHRSARKQLKGARHDLATRLSGSWKSGGDAFSSELLTLAKWRLRGAELKVRTLSEEVAALSWDESFYPVELVWGATRVTASYRLGAETYDVSSYFNFRDRVVSGDPERNVSRDPTEIPSERQILETLAARLGEAIAQDAQRRMAERQDSLFDDARRRFKDGSLDLATESLVAFLLAHRGRRSERVAEALRLLQEMTGCNLTVHWLGA